MSGVAPPLLVAWPAATLKTTGSVVGLMVIAKRAPPGLLLPVPLPLCWATPNPDLHRRPSSTSRQLWLSLRGHCSFPCVLVHKRFYLCPPRVESLFPQSCGNPVIKSCWPSKSDSLRIPSSSVRFPQAGKPDVELRTFTRVRELLWYYISPVCGSPTYWVWDLIFIVIAPPNHLIVASPLSLDIGYLFFLGSRIFLSMVAQLVFWCSQRRKWTHVLLLHHLPQILL